MENRRSFIKKSGLLLAASSLSLAAFPSPFRRKNLLPENKIVTLYVDTSQLQNEDLNEYCHFSDQPDGTSLEDYTVAVNVGDTVTWQGLSSNAPSTDTIHIHSIRHHHGKKVFDQDEFAGDGKNPRISRRVLYSTAGEENFKYILRFTVSINGVRQNQVFHIDPVLQVH